MFRTCKDCTALRFNACTRASACLGRPEGEAPSASVPIDVPEFELKRLDVEENDFLVFRTRAKLTLEQAERIADQVDRHAQQHGFRNVRTIVLDDCTDLSIERPDTRMTHPRRDVPQPMQG